MTGIRSYILIPVQKQSLVAFVLMLNMYMESITTFSMLEQLDQFKLCIGHE